MAFEVTGIVVQAKSEGITQLNTALNKFVDTADKTEKKIVSLNAALESLNLVNKTVSATMDAYMIKLREQAALFQTLNVNARGAAGGTEALAAAMALLAASLNLINLRLQEQDQRQRQSNNSMRDAQALSRGLAGSLGALWVTYGNVMGMAVGLAIGTSLKGIVTIGMEVENTLEGIRVRGEETIETVGKIRDAVLELGKGASGPQEVAKAFDVLVMAGLKGEEALSAIHDAINLSVAGGTSIDKAATSLVQIGTALGYSAAGYGRIADVIAKTAAVSISSVETISESFRAASAVGKMYGQSIVDIGGAIAVLSNLKITGSAGGTSLKNFFSDLNSGSVKVTAGLKMLNLTIDDLKDKGGKFKSFGDIIKTLAGDGEHGLNRMTKASQDLVIAMISNERGNKLMEAGLQALINKVGLTTTQLDDMNKKIDESYGFAARGAAAMALTVESQMKSVKNTLETTLVKAFQGIQPELSVVAQRLKSIFSSPEFIAGMQNLALAVANFTVFLVENSGALWNVIKAIMAFKTISFIAGLLVSIAEGFLAIKSALEVAKISAIAFQASLGLLGLALAAAAAMMVWWASKRDEANATAKTTAALAYMDDFAQKLRDDIELRKRQIKLMQDGESAQGALNRAQQEGQIAIVAAQAQVIVSEAETKYTEAFAMRTVGQQQKIVEAIKRKADGTLASIQISRDEEAGLRQIMPLYNAVIAAKITANAKVAETVALVKEQIAVSKQYAELADKQAKDALTGPSGTGVIPPKTDKKDINATYAAAVIAQDDLIKASKKELATFDIDEAAKFKSGVIGKIQMINEEDAAHLASIEKQRGYAKELERLAVAKGNKPDIQKATDMMKQLDTEVIDARRKKETDLNSELERLGGIATKNKIAELDKQGKFAEAAALKFSEENSKDWARAQLDLEKYGKKFPILQSIVDSFASASAESMKAALNKEGMAEFTVAIGNVNNALKGVKSSADGMGLDVTMETAFEASKKAAEGMEAIRQAMTKITNPADIVKNDAALVALADTQRKMWVGVGESISKSLGEAFGKAGEAAGKFLMVTINSSQIQAKLLEEKKTAMANVDASGIEGAAKAMVVSKIQQDYAQQSASAQIRSYGDMAGAAKNFFKEGSAGYKAMETTERAFRVLELAEALKAFVVKSGFLTSFLAVKVGTDAASTASSQAYTLVEVAQAGIRATASGIAAMASSMVGLPFPYNLAALAATAAALAAIGVAVFGGGGGGSGLSPEEKQAKAGTGSVLGDDKAKSESIAHSIDIIAKNSGLGLVHTQSMMTSLNIMVSSISNLSTAIIKTTGLASKETAGITEGTSLGFVSGLGSINKILDPMAQLFSRIPILANIAGKLFGQTTTVLDKGIAGFSSSLETIQAEGVKVQSFVDVEKKQKLFGVTVSTKDDKQLNTLPKEVTDQFTQIVDSIKNGVIASAKTIGQGGKDFNAHLQQFVVQFDEITTKGLTNEQISAQFKTIFSKISDDMAAFAITGLGEFQKAGEGAFETVSRLANDLQQVTDVFDILGVKFNLTGVEALRASEGLVLVAGGIDKLTNGTKFIVDNFYTEAERMAPITKTVKDAMESLNQPAVKTVEQFDALIHSLDLTNPAQQELYAGLMNVAPAFKQAADYAENLAAGTITLTTSQQHLKDVQDKQHQLDINLLTAQGKSAEALVIQRQDELDALKKLGVKLSDTQAIIYATADALDISNRMHTLDINLLTASGNASGALAATRKDELETLRKISPLLSDMQMKIYAAADALEFSNKKHQLEIEMMTAIGNTSGVLAANRKDELEALGKVSPELVLMKMTIYDMTDAAKSAADAITFLKDALKTAEDAAKNAMDGVKNSVSAEKEALKAAYDAQDALLTAQENTLKSAKTAAEKVINDAKAAEDVQYKAAVKALDAERNTAVEAYKDAVQGVNDAKKASDDAYKAATAALTAEKEAATKIYESAVKVITDQIKAVTDNVSKLTSLSNSLMSTLDSMRALNTEEAYRKQAQKTISNALETANTTGKLPAAEDIASALKTIAQPSESLFGSFEDYQRDFYRTAVDIRDLNDHASGQLNAAQLELEVLTATKDQMQANHEALLAKLDEQRAALDKANELAAVAFQSQLDAMSKAQESLLATFDARKEALTQIHDNTVSASDEQLKNISETLAVALDKITNQKDAAKVKLELDTKVFDDILKAAQASLDAQMKLNNTLLPLPDALAKLGVAISQLKLAQDAVDKTQMMGPPTPTGDMKDQANKFAMQILDGIQSHGGYAKAIEDGNAFIAKWAPTIAEIAHANSLYIATLGRNAEGNAAASLAAQIKATNGNDVTATESLKNSAEYQARLVSQGLQQQVDALVNTALGNGIDTAALFNVPKFANGGDFAGGVRIVGENGPEVEFTGASHIMNAKQMAAAAASGNNNSEIVAELNSLREDMRIALSTIAANTGKTAKKVEDSYDLAQQQDILGLPPVRED